MRKGLTVLSVALTLLMGSAAAQAQFIDFNIGPPGGGSVSYAGGVAPLVGTGIQVDTVTGVGAGPAGVFAITGGVLNFTTGAFTGVVGNTWNFAGGGNITVTGGVPAPFPNPIAAGSTLLSGTFQSAQIVNTGTTILVDVSVFVDSKHDNLHNTYFPGLPNLYTGTLNLSFQIPAAVTTGSAFASSAIGSGDVINVPVPEPASMVLLGIGAVGAFVGYRRRMKVAA